MTPHSGVGGCIPTPKKLNPAALSTAQEIFVVDCVMRGDSALGSRWRNTRRICALPMACAATAYSLTRSTNISPRTRRAYIGINRDCLKTGPEACWQVDTFSGHLTGAQSPQ